MKKIISAFIAVFMLLSFCSCRDGEKKAGKPDIVSIRSICSLATLECCYRNVAKATKEADKGFTHIGEKDRKFWIEYTGTARIGIDLSEVKMETENEKVKIYMPQAKLLSINIDENTLDENSYVISKDGINKNKITVEDQTAAIAAAQENMKKEVESNSALLINAQTRAEKLIENYIRQIGKLSGTDYVIEWEYNTPEIAETQA